jgi:hypothetical protein
MDPRIQYSNDIKELSKAIFGDRVKTAHHRIEVASSTVQPAKGKKTHDGYEIGSRDVSLKDKRSTDSRPTDGAVKIAWNVDRYNRTRREKAIGQQKELQGIQCSGN